MGSVAGWAVLDLKGKPLAVYGSRGKGKDQFDYVHGIAFGLTAASTWRTRTTTVSAPMSPTASRRWISERLPRQLRSNDESGLMPKETSTPHSRQAMRLQLPLGLTVDGAGRVVVADMFDSNLAVFDSKTGKFIAKYGDIGAEDGQFFYPVSVGYDKGRDWFTVADAMNKRVEIVRIPGSAGAGGSAANVNRLMAGPLRACALPLALLLLAMAVFFITRFVRRRRGGAEPGDGEAVGQAV